MSDKDGGPAFPSANDVQVGEFGTGGHSGMTLRDYFAATVGTKDLCSVNVKPDREALAGRPEPTDVEIGIDGIKFNCEVEAALRYIYADAMLAARAKEEGR